MRKFTLLLALGLGSLAATGNATTILKSYLDEVNDANAVLKFPVYSSSGKLIDWKNVKAKEVWPKMDNWSDKVKKKYRNERNSPRVETKMVWDRDLGFEIEDMRVPQEIDQWKNLKKQRDKAKRWKPNKKIEPQQLETSLNRTFGNNSTFGVFQNGNFTSKTESEKVEVNQSFSAGGFVFGKRVSLVSQTTTSNSKSKTTTSNIRVFDTSVFVSKDGTLNARKSFTRAKDASKVFVLGILPVRVTGKISGTMGADFSYKSEGLSMVGSVAPFVNTRGTASAGIDLLLVVAGIEGSLTFLSNTLSANFAAAIDPFEGEAKTSLKVQNNLNLLKGNISVFAKIRRLFRRDKKFSKSIFSFAGITQNTTLIDESLKAEL